MEKPIEDEIRKVLEKLKEKFKENEDRISCREHDDFPMGYETGKLVGVIECIQILNKFAEDI